MIMLVCSYPRGPNGILGFRDKLISRGWAKSVLSHKCFKKRNTKCDTKTATLFYHTTAACSCSMGWSSCLVRASTHTSLRSNIYVLTFSFALVNSHARMQLSKQLCRVLLVKTTYCQLAEYTGTGTQACAYRLPDTTGTTL